MFEKRSSYTDKPCFQMFLAKFLAVTPMLYLGIFCSFSDIDYAGALSHGYLRIIANFNAITKIIFTKIIFHLKSVFFTKILCYENLELYGTVLYFAVW